MAPQKSDHRVVPKGRRKSVSTRESRSSGGGTAVTVDEQTEQLGLRFETAEERPRSGRSDGGGDTSLIVPPPSAVPKSKRKEEKALSATME